MYILFIMQGNCDKYNCKGTKKINTKR